MIRAKDENDKFQVKEESGSIIDFRVMGAGVLIICAFFVLGGLLEKVVGIPGPVMMILAAVLLNTSESCRKNWKKVQTLFTN